MRSRRRIALNCVNWLRFHRIEYLDHTTKHATGTDALRRGHSMESVAALFGHRDRRSTERYAKLSKRAPLDVLRRPACSPLVARGRTRPPSTRKQKEKWRGGRDSNPGIPRISPRNSSCFFRLDCAHGVLMSAKPRDRRHRWPVGASCQLSLGGDRQTPQELRPSGYLRQAANRRPPRWQRS